MKPKIVVLAIIGVIIVVLVIVAVAIAIPISNKNAKEADESDMTSAEKARKWMKETPLIDWWA